MISLGRQGKHKTRSCPGVLSGVVRSRQVVEALGCGRSQDMSCRRVLQTTLSDTTLFRGCPSVLLSWGER